jgi:hypothetical protein
VLSLHRLYVYFIIYDMYSIAHITRKEEVLVRLCIFYMYYIISNVSHVIISITCKEEVCVLSLHMLYVQCIFLYITCLVSYVLHVSRSQSVDRKAATIEG